MEQDNMGVAEQDNPGFVTSQPADVHGLFRRRAAVVEPEPVEPEPVEPVVVTEAPDPDKALKADKAPKV